jgi:hypothetical protein
MYHPLYPVARSMVGRPVNVHHINGRRYRGTLQSVAPHGIYLLPHGGRLASGSKSTESVELAENHQLRDEDVNLVYAPAAFFGFGALTGLTLGALAGGYYW